MRIISSGKRKRAVARAMLTEGTGKITYKNQDYKSLQIFDRLKLEEPVRIAEAILGKVNFDAKLTVKGGGEDCKLYSNPLKKFSTSKNQIGLVKKISTKPIRCSHTFSSSI